MRHQQLQHAATKNTFRSVCSFTINQVALTTTFSSDCTPIFFSCKRVMGHKSASSPKLEGPVDGRGRSASRHGPREGFVYTPHFYHFFFGA